MSGPRSVWRAALLASARRRRRLHRAGLATALGTALLGATLVVPPAPWLVWNASASTPTGLYGVLPGGEAVPGGMAVAWLPEGSRSFAARRGYLPANVPLVKRVAAGPGDIVCAAGGDVSINGRAAATRLAVDARGRPMPWWTGCWRLGARQVFLLGDAPGSFDGRYFGISDQGDIIGPASLLWAR